MNQIPAFENFPFRIEPLTAEDGGGFAINFPDLPGCISDGETPEEAIANGRDAFNAWMEAIIEEGKPIPKPNGEGEPARFVQRLPKYLHAALTRAATSEGTSMNNLVTLLVAEGLARRDTAAAPASAKAAQRKALIP